MSKPEISSGRALSPILRYGLALASPCVALAVALLLVRYGFTNSVFLFGIAIVSWFAGPGPAVLAVVLSTVAHAYFFIEPLYSFVITPSEIPQLDTFRTICVADHRICCCSPPCGTRTSRSQGQT